MTIANFTRAQLLAEVKRRLNEASADGAWTTTEINSFIDRSILRLAMDLKSDTAEATINLRLNVAWYRLPSDMLLPLFLYGPSIWDNSRLFPTSLTAMDKYDGARATWETATKGRSTLFIPFSYDKFIIWPPPDQSTSVTLFYIPNPTALAADATTTGLQLQAQRLLPIYTTYLLLRRHDFDKARALLAEYKQRLVVVKRELSTVTGTQAPRLAPAKVFDRAHGAPEFRRMGRIKGYY